MSHLPLSFLDPGQLGVFIPILGIVAGIVAILSKHQQRMAEIIHAAPSGTTISEIAELRQEVFELKQLVHEQMIALDSYAGRSRVQTDIPLQRRLEEV